MKREKVDLMVRDLILSVFNRCGYQKGSLQIKMPLVTEIIEKLFRTKRIPLHPEVFINSDQREIRHQSNLLTLIKEKRIRTIEVSKGELLG